MRVLITGGTGFVGGALVRALRARGDDVTALVRDPRKAGPLADLGATLVEDDLSDVDRLTGVLGDANSDAVIHAAGSYRIEVSKADRGAMWDANVGTTTRLLDAAEAAGSRRIVYLSTVNVFGNTNGAIVDETYRRNLAEGFVSWYDETKYGAHEIAEQRIAGGAPIVIAMPGQVIGPGDHSEIGARLGLAAAGRLRYVASAGMGVNLVHIDDEAAGIVAALDAGEPGRSYILAGECLRFGEALAIAAATRGRRLPRLRIPDSLLRVVAPFGPLVGQPHLRVVAAASLGVTYWASSQRAADELGYRPRSAEDAIRDTFGAA